MPDSILTKTKSHGRKPAPTDINRHPRAEPHYDGKSDEIAAFIAEIVTDLARLAQHHRLEMLGHLLRMSQLEAEEHMRLRSKPKTS